MNNDMKKLMRSRGNKMIWAICSVASVGMGLLVYFLAAVVMPENDDIMM